MENKSNEVLTITSGPTGPAALQDAVNQNIVLSTTPSIDILKMVPSAPLFSSGK